MSKHVPPKIGKAVPGAKQRMAELYEAIISSPEINKYGPRKKAVAAATSWKQFKKEYVKKNGVWVKVNPGWKAAKKAIKKKLHKKVAKKKRRNPDMTEAERRFEMFHEGDAPTVEEEKKINVPDLLVDMGELVALTYRTHKDGKVAVWEHEFDSCPQLACGPNGKNIQIIGGKYTVTERGIVG